MISDNDIRSQIPFVLTSTSLEGLGEKYVGKVRDNYTSAGLRYIITSDRLSCFDVVVTAVPFKGQVLNQIALYWFEKTRHIIENHVVDAPDPNVIVGRLCQVLPVEVVVRAYLAGSAWRDYEAGRPISGVRLPPGLRSAEKLPELFVTPSTKAEKGAHDKPVSEEEIVSSGLVEEKLWRQIREVSLELFRAGEEQARKQGLILADTKYEFGLSQGQLFLVDEIHTLDSSRYWVGASYRERFERGEAQEMLDKEPTRQWLLKQGFSGDGAIPEFTVDHRVEISKHYISSFERITGRQFHGSVGDVQARIAQNLTKFRAAGR